MKNTLKHSVEIAVKFSEVDSLGIVWHGHYVRYFEDGREAFGLAYGIDYLTIHSHGFAVPLVSIDCKYKRELKYGDRVIIETELLANDAAKMCFNYKLLHAATGDEVATGSTVQVFVDVADHALQLITPPFFEEWKQQHHLG